eukprot:5853017-Amphidinium_carterae.3
MPTTAPMLGDPTLNAGGAYIVDLVTRWLAKRDGKDSSTLLEALKMDVAARGSISFNSSAHPGLAARLGSPVAGYSERHLVMDAAIPDATGMLDGYLEALLTGKLHEFTQSRGRMASICVERAKVEPVARHKIAQKTRTYYISDAVERFGLSILAHRLT